VNVGQSDAAVKLMAKKKVFSRPYYLDDRAYATVLRLSVCLSVVCCLYGMYCGYKRYVLKQKLLLTAYRKSCMEIDWYTKINNLDFCLEVVSRVMSNITLHST